MKPLTLNDILNDRIDKEVRQGEKKKFYGYRIFTGDYEGQFETAQPQEANDKRRCVNCRVTLYRPDGKFAGGVFLTASWQHRYKEGKPDLQTKLFSNILQALDAPASAIPHMVVEALPGEWAIFHVQEYFDVPLKDIVDPKVAEEAAKRGKSSAWHFIDKTMDAIANRYLELGYKSKGMVLWINKLTEVKASVDDDIPF